MWGIQIIQLANYECNVREIVIIPEEGEKLF